MEGLYSDSLLPSHALEKEIVLFLANEKTWGYSSCLVVSIHLSVHNRHDSFLN
jgi:hypothetical protein